MLHHHPLFQAALRWLAAPAHPRLANMLRPYATGFLSFIFSPFPTVQNIRFHTQYRISMTAIIIPASLNTATLLPDCAMRVSRPAEPFNVVPSEEKVSEVLSMSVWSRALS